MAVDEEGWRAVDSAADAAAEISADVIGELSLLQRLAQRGGGVAALRASSRKSAPLRRC